jgi:hypothetical protein
MDKHSLGVTPTERHLALLCKRTFLSLWSYPNVHRDEFIPGTHTGKEVCDLLVVFDDRIIIFSDKACDVSPTANLALLWARWFRRNVLESLKQVRGAERWIRTSPHRLFLDKECRRPLPALPTVTAPTSIHLVIVTHKIANHYRQHYGGSGSLMINFALKGAAAHIEPFTIGDLNPGGSFVHVLDDTSLPIIMTEFDTIRDFVAYLDRREDFARSSGDFFAAGEEELLAVYLKGIDETGEHAFIIPREPEPIGVGEGGYAAYLSSPQRLEKIKADEMSYLWDKLIEGLTGHVLADTLYSSDPGGVAAAEKLLRFMARESRLRRRHLARNLVEAMTIGTDTERRLRVLLPSMPGDPYYFFLRLRRDETMSYEEYRQHRLSYIQDVARVVRWKCADAVNVIGIAREGEDNPQARAHDAIYADFRRWTAADEILARDFQSKTGLLTDPVVVRQIDREFPEPLVVAE